MALYFYCFNINSYCKCWSLCIWNFRSDPATFGHSAGELIIIEGDPKVGTITNNKWCMGSGGQVVCNQNAPSFSESDTLQSVTNRGASTTQAITVSGLTVGGNLFTTRRHMNLGEDIYPRWVASARAGDTCTGNNDDRYTCSSNEERTCTDIARVDDGSIPLFGWGKRIITCKANYVLTRY